jgi:spore coat polysaccharide biosynthesis protein SpsF (cytidylyltransferase family)
MVTQELWQQKVVCVIQARLGSTRLPRKTLADLHGYPIIEHVVQRARGMRLCDSVMAVVPEGDHELIDVLQALNVDVVTGSETNVLERYVLAAERYNATYVVRVTGDCPFFDPRAGDEVIKLMQQHVDCYYASNNTLTSGWPDGTDVEVTRRYLLTEALSDPHCTDTDREHVTTWIQRQCLRSSPSHVRHAHVLTRPTDALSSLKLSIDTQENLDTARAIWKARPPINYSIEETAESFAAGGLL